MNSFTIYHWTLLTVAIVFLFVSVTEAVKIGMKNDKRFYGWMFDIFAWLIVILQLLGEL